MPKKLEGRVAVITGGTEGIGLATAKLFVNEGAYVFITGRRQKELDEAVNAIGTNVSGVQGDIGQLPNLDRLYETVSNVKGRIDIVFANAGVGEFVPFGAVSEEHFDKLFNINVRGTLFTVQKALPLLKDGGSIILNGSVASVKGTVAFGVYAASKAAIRSFVRTWTTDLADRQIRSNVVSPGPIETGVIRRQKQRHLGNFLRFAHASHRDGGQNPRNHVRRLPTRQRRIVGYMGRPIARRLLEAGFNLTAYDRDRGKAEELIRYGGTVAESVAQLSSTCDLLLSCLPSDEAVLEVYKGPEGAFANALRGALVIDMSTVNPQTSLELSKLGSERGVDVLDVTISGSTPAAEQGR